MGDSGTITIDCVAQQNMKYPENGFFIGDQILLSGTNSVAGPTFLYMKGPGLPDDGVPLTNPTQRGFVNIAEVDGNDCSWEFVWDTSVLNGYLLNPIVAGDYTIYAIDGDNYGKCASVDCLFKVPFIAATLSSPVIKQGEDISIVGWAAGSPNNVYLWILADNYQLLFQSLETDQNGYFEYTINSDNTQNLPNGDYYLILQHPMYDGQPDVTAESGSVIYLEGKRTINLKGNSGYDSAKKVRELIYNSGHDDVCIPTERLSYLEKFSVDNTADIFDASDAIPTFDKDNYQKESEDVSSDTVASQEQDISGSDAAPTPEVTMTSEAVSTQIPTKESSIVFAPILCILFILIFRIIKYN
ncbi:MAG: hypothetical protein QCI00_07020 [Candidatus Thermoplasmatota archaeon]|nr:hypothetical protein [Candidatus Thermoplasmatota archaeon]